MKHKLVFDCKPDEEPKAKCLCGKVFLDNGKFLKDDFETHIEIECGEAVGDNIGGTFEALYGYIPGCVYPE